MPYRPKTEHYRTPSDSVWSSPKPCFLTGENLKTLEIDGCVGVSSNRTQNPLPARACGFKSLLRYLFSRGFRFSGVGRLPRTKCRTHSEPITRVLGNGFSGLHGEPPLPMDGSRGFRLRPDLRQRHRPQESSSPIFDAGAASTASPGLQDPVRQESPMVRNRVSWQGQGSHGGRS
jgi:hypothetical protein